MNSSSFFSFCTLLGAHAWVLRNVKLTEEEWKYEHPKGAIIWVKDVMPAYELQTGYIDVILRNNM